MMVPSMHEMLIPVGENYFPPWDEPWHDETIANLG